MNPNPPLENPSPNGKHGPGPNHCPCIRCRCLLVLLHALRLAILIARVLMRPPYLTVTLTVAGVLSTLVFLLLLVTYH